MLILTDFTDKTWIVMIFVSQLNLQYWWGHHRNVEIHYLKKVVPSMLVKPSTNYIVLLHCRWSYDNWFRTLPGHYLDIDWALITTVKRSNLWDITGRTLWPRSSSSFDLKNNLYFLGYNCILEIQNIFVFLDSYPLSKVSD